MVFKLKQIWILGIFLTMIGCKSANKQAYNYGLVVGNSSSSPTYLHNAYQYFTPGSCLKFITGLVAYKELGTDFKYETRFYRSGKDFLLEFTGDPNLTSLEVYKLLHSLKNKKILGNLIIDISIFHLSEWSPNIPFHSKGTISASPVSAAIIDRNVKVHDLEPYITSKIRETLQELNISLKGNIVFLREKTNKPKTLINLHISEPLNKFLKDAMYKSDNLVFDSLYLTLLHKFNPGCSDWSDGDKVIKERIKKYYDIDLGESLIIDGSGLSHFNKIQPIIFWQLLKEISHEKEYIEYLPRPGSIDSTLKDSKLPGSVHAKTGSLFTVRGLVGYNLGIKNPQIFVLMFNNFRANGDEMRKVEEKILKKYLR